MKCSWNACIANGGESEVALVMARADVISCGLRKNCPPFPSLPSLPHLCKVGLLFANFIRPRRASPHEAALLMWCMAPDSLREPHRPTEARDHHRANSAQRESCHYGRLIDRVKANENTWNPIWPRTNERRKERARPPDGSESGNRSRPSTVVFVRTDRLKAPPKKSNSQRATFFRSHVNDRRRLARVRVVIPQ